jgi:hypothetical protein
MADDASDTDEAARKRKKGTWAGVAMIAFGLIGAVVSYVQDVHSFDYFKTMHAKDFAILHAVLWTIAGLIVIAWHNRPPPDNSNTYDPNDPYR